MDRVDKYHEIIKHFIPTRLPNITVIEKKDNTVLQGYFLSINVPHEAQKKQKLLFVPNEKKEVFRDRFLSERASSQSLEQCIEVDVDEIRNVKLINAFNNQLQFSLGLS